jgi:LysR family transcriptional regulator, glycine cleavage system transcriptional activator
MNPMSRRLPPLSYVRAFEAAARLGSVSRAATELGRTHGAISKQLQLFQDHAGVRLFERAGTGIRLNRHGRAFLAVVSEVLDRLEHGYIELQNATEEQSIHVGCGATFAMRWLVPHLGAFYQLHPEWRVQLTMTSRSKLLDHRDRIDGPDVKLSWDRLASPAIVPQDIPLTDVEFGLVSARHYPVVIDGSYRRFATRICHEHTPEAWPRWQAATGIDVTSTAELVFPHSNLCIGAAIAGIGVALVELRLVRDELASGQLIAQPGTLQIDKGFVARPNSLRELPLATETFLDWLRETLAADEDP